MKKKIQKYLTVFILFSMAISFSILNYNFLVIRNGADREKVSFIIFIPIIIAVIISHSVWYRDRSKDK